MYICTIYRAVTDIKKGQAVEVRDNYKVAASPVALQEMFKPGTTIAFYTKRIHFKVFKKHCEHKRPHPRKRRCVCRITRMRDFCTEKNCPVWRKLSE